MNHCQKVDFLVNYINKKNNEKPSCFLSTALKKQEIKRNCIHQLIALKFLCRLTYDMKEHLTKEEFTHLRITYGYQALDIVDELIDYDEWLTSNEYQAIFNISAAVWDKHYGQQDPDNLMAPIYIDLLSKEPIADVIGITLFAQEMMLNPTLRKNVKKVLGSRHLSVKK